MCGIIGYIGKKQASPILLDGLKKLEYRGYDSCGMATISEKRSAKSDQRKYIIIDIKKGKGKIEEVDKKVDFQKMKGVIGIAHTRWATHGRPTVVNAHPHFDCRRQIFVVHNGIIENYQELKKELEAKGHKFISQTDSEVIAHLIEEEYHQISNIKNQKSKIETAVKQALRRIIGAYGLAIISSPEPDKIIVAKNGSPIIIGVGKRENIIASDAAAVLARTKQVIYLNDGEMAVVTDKEIKITDLFDRKVKNEINTIDWTVEQISQGGFPHYMLKEIFEQPRSILNSIRGRYILENGEAKLGGLEGVVDRIEEIKNIIIVACGTARLAGMAGKYMIEEFAGIATEVDYAHEFRYRNPIIGKGTVLIAISQSGETADTLAAVREAKGKGALTLGIVNVVGSTIARETDAGVYNHSGPEISVASTKAFTSQLIIMALLSVWLGRKRRMSRATGKKILGKIARIPNLVEKLLKESEDIKKIAQKYHQFKNFAILGRKYNHPIALEGAIKIKEISYIHAEGFASGEMKHGPIAMIDEHFPAIFIAPRDSVYEKNLNGMQEIKARGGRIIAIASEGDDEIKRIADEVIYIPKTLEMLTPLLTVIPLQLLAYYIGVEKGFDVDKPRNLAKSVTVE